ncbi:MAG: hypothetical protein QM762_28145 [Chryseolinea sp.]
MSKSSSNHKKDDKAPLVKGTGESPGPIESANAAEALKSKPAEEADEEPKPFDFGGLPNRNLKKNLGCG